MANLKFIILLLSLGVSAFAKVPVEDQIHQLSLYLEEAQFQLNHHKVEIDLFHDRLASMEAQLQKKLDELSVPKTSNLDTSKVALLEERQKALTADLGKLAKQHAEMLSSQAKLEAQVNEKLSKINKSISQVLTLLDNNNQQKSQTYVVQSGDSLGKIAADFHVALEELKKLNQLPNDHIYVGQKLRIP